MNDERSGERRERIVSLALKAGTVALAISAGSIAVEKADNGWSFSLGCTPKPASEQVIDNGVPEIPDIPDEPELPAPESPDGVTVEGGR